MTTTTNCIVRFCNNQFVESVTAYSSQDSSYPASNVYDPMRSRKWLPTGHFVIDSTNNKIYIDSATGTIASNTYATASALATAIQSACNAASSGWTVSYSATTLKFTLAKSGGVLNLGSTSNSCWDLIGVTGTGDQNAPYVADEVRIHQYEYLLFDLGYSATIEAFHLICPIDEILNFSASATIKIQANTINSWAAPALDVTLTKSDYGIFHYFDDIADTDFRYWRFYFEDRTNSDTSFNISHIYLGDYVTLVDRNINNGFTYEIVDQSEKYQSEKGNLYFDKKPKYFRFRNNTISYIQRVDRRTLERMYQQLGTYTPFYLSLDPRQAITTDPFEFTKYVVFEDSPDFQHIIYDKFSINMTFREVI